MWSIWQTGPSAKMVSACTGLLRCCLLIFLEADIDMDFESLFQGSADKLRSFVVRNGVEALSELPSSKHDRNRGKFFANFFTWGIWKDDWEEKLSILVENKLDLNSPICKAEKYHLIPLFFVIKEVEDKNDKLKAIKILYQLGADLNARDDDGRTALMLASTDHEDYIWNKRILSAPSVVKALITRGADMTLTDRKGKLATDLADEKSLPILIKAGAPINLQSMKPLLSAVRSQDLNLALELIRKGMNTELPAADVLQTSAFLETLAKTEPGLFGAALALEPDPLEKEHRHSTSRLDFIRNTRKKASLLFNRIRESTSEIPPPAAVQVSTDVHLPPVFSSKCWPPLSPGLVDRSKSKVSELALTAAESISSKLLSECEIFLGLSPADEARAQATQDAADEYMGFSDFNLKRTRKEISAALEQISSKIKLGKLSYHDFWDYRYNFWQLPWLEISDLEFVWRDFRDHLEHLFHTRSLGRAHNLTWLVKKLGSRTYDGILEWAVSGDRLAVHLLTRFETARTSPCMASFLADTRFTRKAQRWFLAYPDTAIRGLLADLADPQSKTQLQTAWALRWLASLGYQEMILSVAASASDTLHTLVEASLTVDRSADFLPRKMPALPQYFIVQTHPAPCLKINGLALPEHAIETLARMMLVSNCHLQTPAMAQVLAACEPNSLEDFAISTFEVWRKNGAKKAEIGFLHALAYMGGDRSAALLSNAYKNAPFTSDTEAAIECLGALGSSIALSGLQAIIKFSKYEKAQQRAREVLEDIAEMRGLTADQLEDLAIPDFGLDLAGKAVLDFGTRQFTARITPNLALELSDADGKMLKAIPKPLKNDDEKLTKQAIARWKELKDHVKNTGSQQLKRFEQAMMFRRRWDARIFQQTVVPHPLVGSMVRHLVWAILDKDSGDLTSFRIDTNGRAITASASAIAIAEDANIILPHPLLLHKHLQEWRAVFAENRLEQPFPQLARAYFPIGPETEALIEARKGAKVPLGSLRGLSKTGWTVGDSGAGIVWNMAKHIGDVRASINVDPGWSLSGADLEDFGGDQAVELDIYGDDEIAYSELVRDFMALPVVTA
jgi:hypothetical protein